MLLPQVRSFSSCTNYNLEPGKPVREKVEARMFGDNGIIVWNVETELVDKGSPKRPAEISIKRRADPVSMRKALLNLMRSMNANAGIRTDPSKIPTVDRQDEITCRGSVVSGDPVSVRESEIVTSGNVTRTKIVDTKITRLR